MKACAEQCISMLSEVLAVLLILFIFSMVTVMFYLAVQFFFKFFRRFDKMLLFCSQCLMWLRLLWKVKSFNKPSFIYGLDSLYGFFGTSMILPL